MSYFLLFLHTHINSIAYKIYSVCKILARDKGERKLFGFAFARLMEECGATISDGQHELYIYKCEDPLRYVTIKYNTIKNVFYTMITYSSEKLTFVGKLNSYLFI